jgi:uncharacterized protein YcbK (DUF882 family)/peptidoglycan hydrolase-like protein with peptidoglycan-binding domain
MAASTLHERLRAAKIAAPRIAIEEAKRAGLPLELACALLEKESGGGANVYGHDPSIFSGAGQVTRENYARYKKARIASGNRKMQGVGPCQLTWWEFQDQADAQGGCWRPRYNMRVGFLHLANLIKRYGESDGARRYNGSGSAAEAYSRDLLVKAAKWKSVIGGLEAPAPSSPTMLREGDKGASVEKLTKRLSRVRSPKTKKPYLEGVSRVLTGAVADAVKDFQRDHGLEVDGVAGPQTRSTLRTTDERQRRKRAAQPAQPTQPAQPADKPVRRKDKRAPVRVTVLAHEVERLEDETQEAWRKLVAYGHRRRRRLLAERAELQSRSGGLDTEELKLLLEALARIEGKLGTLVDIQQHKPEAPNGDEAQPPVEGPVIVTQADVPVVPAVTPEPAAASPEPQPAAAATVTVAVAEAPAAGPEMMDAAKPLKDYAVPELVRRVEALEKEAHEARVELIGRYEAVDEELAKLLGPDDDDDEPRRRSAPADRNGGGTRHVNGRPAEKRRRDRVVKPAPAERDPLGGKVVNTTLGDRGVFVRRSKIALSRYLAKKGNPEHRALRRKLRREAATPRTGGIASPAWQQAVKAVQHISGRPVTGELDGELTKVLQDYWPRDNPPKRILRATPGWRVIPGQLTPNFNVKEFACKDGARTPYIKGLMREQGLSKKDAKARAKGLAERLERVRKLSGDRPIVINSAYRTKAYNASLTGSATNSAHTRGYACDTTPPRGISLDQHKAHVTQAFECGVGYYPMGRGYFIHGDFDKTLGGRRFW